MESFRAGSSGSLFKFPSTALSFFFIVRGKCDKAVIPPPPRVPRRTLWFKIYFLGGGEGVADVLWNGGRHTHRTGSECRRQDERSTGMTFDLHGYESHRGSRKSTTSLSAKRTASPRLDAYCWEQEPDRTTEGWVGSPAARKACFVPFSVLLGSDLTKSSPSRTFCLVKKGAIKTR